MAETFHYHFEWDPQKAVQNIRKHGVSFEQAATVFNDSMAVTIHDEEHSEKEERWITLGLTSAGVLTVVHTFRDINTSEALVRIISARKATKREQHDYEAGS